MRNIIKFDFQKRNFLKIRQDGLNIRVSTNIRSVYTSTNTLSWILEEDGLTVEFFKKTGNDDFEKFLANSPINQVIETLFLFWLHEAVLRFTLYRAGSEEMIKKTDELISYYQKKYKKQVKVFKIDKENDPEIKLAKLRILECYYEMKLFNEKELKRIMEANIIYASE